MTSSFAGMFDQFLTYMFDNTMAERFIENQL